MQDQARSRDLFVTGLKNAHAMESQALSIMKPQAKRIDSYPQLKARLDQHIEETRVQVERLEGLLDKAGADHSVLKDAAMSMAGGMSAMGHAAASDEVLKNTIADYAFENYEIAAYRSLIALAENAGEAGAVPTLRQSLSEEEAMAGWLSENLEPITHSYAALSTAGADAKK